jgi:hypothetical protein
MVVVKAKSKSQMKMTGGSGKNNRKSKKRVSGLGPKTPQDIQQPAASVTPERAQDIQKSLSTFRDTVISRQVESCSTNERILDWVAAHMLGRGVTPCSADEMDIVLGALIQKDAVMSMEGKVYFV